MGLLHSPGGWGALPSRLGGELLPWRLSSSRFTGSLFGTGHVVLPVHIYGTRS